MVLLSDFFFEAFRGRSLEIICHEISILFFLHIHIQLVSPFLDARGVLPFFSMLMRLEYARWDHEQFLCLLVGWSPWSLAIFRFVIFNLLHIHWLHVPSEVRVQYMIEHCASSNVNLVLFYFNSDSLIPRAGPLVEKWAHTSIAKICTDSSPAHLTWTQGSSEYHSVDSSNLNKVYFQDASPIHHERRQPYAFYHARAIDTQTTLTSGNRIICWSSLKNS